MYYLGDIPGRYFRTGTMLVFLVAYALRFYLNKIFLAVFIFFTLCDIFLVFYEQIEFTALTYITRITAYFLMVAYLYPFLHRLKLSAFTGLISLFVISINVYLISIMVESVPEAMQSSTFQPLFYLFGIALLAQAAFAFSYHSRFATKQSFFLVIASFGLIFSDVTYYIAYYLGFNGFFFIDRFSNILGIAFLLAFCAYTAQDIEPEAVKIPQLSDDEN
ncbi:hypothetical protein [Christiangramia aquimixticola]|uniref:hypothetical protein n=1 Tax=Christiangramia aquimixticola TaxID=1697558 RepID=UPI003AA99D75